jgi:hypothetical protein
VAAALLLPASAEAQGRRAVPRSAVSRPAVVRSRPAVRVGVYYGPSLYRPYYASPFYWSPFYGYGYYGSPYYYSQWYPPYYYGGGFEIAGSLRLQVGPRDTQVFVDGYYAGVVDEFDGVFQRLRVEAGEHDLELFLPGHRSLQQRVYVQPGRTFSIRHEMEPLGPGEREPIRPEGTASRPIAPRDRERPVGPPPARPRDDGIVRGGDDRGRDGTPVATAGFGALAVRVQPGDAIVTIDGEPWEGASDNERLVVQLSTGVHAVEIRKEGYRTYVTDVTVLPGETAALNVSLTAAK